MYNRRVLLLLLALLFLIACDSSTPTSTEVVATEVVVTEVVTTEVVVTEVVPTDVVVTEVVVTEVVPTEVVPTEVVATVTPPLTFCPEPLKEIRFDRAGNDHVNYVPNQLVISTQLVNGDDPTENIISEVNTAFGAVIGGGLFSLPFTEDTGGETVVALYESADNVIAIATAFNDIARNMGLIAAAEPNYIVSQPKGLGTSGDPGSSGVEGNPGSSGVEGNPGSSGVEGNAGAPPAIASTDFVAQWALSQTSRSDDGYFLAGTPTRAQNPANLIILDASSLEDGRYMYDQLNVCNLLGAAGTGAMDRHGLFVASLASATATERNAYLIQVLEEVETEVDGETRVSIRGDLYTILGILHTLAQNPPTDRAFAHTVINLSLGFEFNPQDPEHSEFIGTLRQIRPNPEESDNDKRISELWEGLANEFAAEVPDEWREWAQFEIGHPVVSLYAIFDTLDENGYVVVAAAGNDAQQMPQSPASFRPVVGVQATNLQTQARSCFSNRGNISAPGGGDGSGAPGDRTPADPLIACDLDLKNVCTGNPTCPLALTGHLSGTVQSGAVQLGYWAGTSFAAPLVSGVGVTIINLANERGTPLTPFQVRQVIYCSATGVIESGDPDAHVTRSGIVNADVGVLGECIAKLSP